MLHRSQCIQIPKLSTGKTLDDQHPNARQLGARFAIQMLSAVNMLNFADRYIPLSVKPLFQEDLGLTDFESSLPTTGMTLVFMVFALIFGTLSDKALIDRRFLLSIGIIIWSVATSLAGLSTNLIQLVCIRSLVGIGEACYGTIAPPMISDFYPEHERNIAYSIYYLAVPVGGAIGYVLGAVLGSAFGWRIAFLVCGVPGIILAVLIIQLNNPTRGINDNYHSNKNNNDNNNSNNNNSNNSYDDPQQHLPLVSNNGKIVAPVVENGVFEIDHVVTNHRSTNHNSHINNNNNNNSTHSSDDNIHHHRHSHSHHHHHHGSSSFATAMDEMRDFRNDIWELLTNPAYMLATGGMTAGSFALSGLSEWYGVFTMRYMNATLSVAGVVLGVATIVGGIGGTLLGSKVAEYYQPKIKNAYFFIPAVFVLLGAFFCLLAVNITVNFTLNVFLALCVMIAVWTNNGPISAISVSSVPPRLRSRSAGLQIFLQYVFGGMISPPIIGAMSDSSGSLQAALQITWMALVVAFGFWFSGYFFLPAMNTNLKNNTKQQQQQQQRLLSPNTRSKATSDSSGYRGNNSHDEAVTMTGNISAEEDIVNLITADVVINPLIQPQQQQQQQPRLDSELESQMHLISSADEHSDKEGYTNNRNNQCQNMNINTTTTTNIAATTENVVTPYPPPPAVATFMSILFQQDPLTLDADGLTVVVR